MSILSQKKGFTLFELTLVIVILAVLGAIAIPNFLIFLRTSDLDNGSQEFANILRLAQSRALASEQSSKYGVYLDTISMPQKYVLFKGNTYETRETSFDQLYFLPNTVEFSTINLGGATQIVFDKLTGVTEQPGDVSFKMKKDASQQRTIFISDSGIINFSLPVTYSDQNRIKDSRHLHFDYSRLIDINTEEIVLTFNGNVVQIFPIASNLIGGQIEWEGTVNVAGKDQKVKIHTHRLNNPDTLFSLHRDRRFNDKTLLVSISGDSSGSLADYSANGLITSFSSIYVSNFAWQ